MQINNIFYTLFIRVNIFLILILSFVLLSSCQEVNKFNKISHAESGFLTIPDSIQTSAYWYWVSDNLSKEGVVKDLEAMKRIGINRAFIGNVAIKDNPPGSVALMSDAWWEILHTALKTATELNIEIGIFNSPGWSQSGGPWISQEQSMRYLNTVDTTVIGPGLFEEKLPPPAADFQPVHVIAYKIPDGDANPYEQLNQKITSIPSISNINQVADGNNQTGIKLHPGNDLIIDFKADEKATLRSVTVETTRDRTIAQAEIFVRKNDAFQSIKKFEINRSNFRLEVGFNPYAPIVVAIPEIEASHFRIVLSDVETPGGISEITLSSNPRVERFAEKSLAKLSQVPMPQWDDYVWFQQPAISNSSLVIDPDAVLDITEYREADGTISWQVPAGQWKIMETGMTATGVTNHPASKEGTGPETDKMSKKHIKHHFESFLGEIIRRIPEADRKSWKVVVLDSYETGGQNWTDGLTAEFMDVYGYSPLPYLPVLQGNVVGSPDLSDRFLWDLRRLVADKIAYDYVGGLREISHQYGLTTWLENYGHWGFPAEFLQYGGQSDEVAGEFWIGNELGGIENKAASSCAHIYGKRKVSSESFTSGGVSFSRHPAMMKQRADRFFTEGVNNTLLHVYIHQPDDKQPGMNAWFGSAFNRNNTWFDYMGPFMDYIKRTNFMLQHGRYVADVAYFIGEDTPKMTGSTDPELPEGYSYDFINAEVIHTRVDVKENRLVLPDGMSYRVLVLPDMDTMRPELLRKIHELILQGAIVLGNAPSRSPSLENYPDADEMVKELVDQIWGKVQPNENFAKLGKGMIFTNTGLQEVLEYLNIPPDFKVGTDDILFIHRELDDADVYFISNQSNSNRTIHPEFRIVNRKPEYWNPIQGTIRNLPEFTQKEQSTVVRLQLSPAESQFIVFRKEVDPEGSSEFTTNIPKRNVLVSLNGPWTVTFDKTKGGPVHPVQFNRLSNWTVSTNDSIRFYSGTAVYKTKVEVNDSIKNRNLVLHLGNLMTMAKVFVNGKEAGGVWTPPREINVSGMIQNGVNEIEIHVVNNWINRLIGDLRLTKKQQIASIQVKRYHKNTPLQPSGLFGPVTLVEYVN